jgi:hypothetical protein
MRAQVARRVDGGLVAPVVLGQAIFGERFELLVRARFARGPGLAQARRPVRVRRQQLPVVEPVAAH